MTYANIDGWTPAKNAKPKNISVVALDRWILSRLAQTVKGVNDSLDSYDAYSASGVIESFVDDLSLWYIRRSRDRVGPDAKEGKDKDSFYETCYWSLVTLSQLLAPFLPTVSEVMYKNLTKEESVHLSDWPEISHTVDKKLIEDMAYLREIVEKIHAERKVQQILVRQPLSTSEVVSDRITPSAELLTIAKDEVNVQQIKFKKGKELRVSLDTTITPELEEESRKRDLIRRIQEERKNMGMNLTQKINVFNPWLPKDKKLVQRIKDKTLASKLTLGDFKVTKA